MATRNPRPRRQRALRAGGAGAALALVAGGTMVLSAQTAHAATATAKVVGETLIYQAIPGQANDLKISRTAAGQHLVDDAFPITADSGCKAVPGDATIVICDPLPWNGKVTIDVGDGNDKVILTSPFPSEISGGTGNDELTGGSAYGAMGERDVLRGGEGADILKGREGPDTLDGGLGADIFNGGADSDVVTYEGRTATVTADLAGDRDDGEAGEQDTIAADVESLSGGEAADVLTGNAGGNGINGNGGNDTIKGGGGDDYLLGGAGIDTIEGEAGNDDLLGGPGGTAAQPQVLNGGAGDDRLHSGPTADRMIGGPGIDHAYYHYDHPSSAPVTVDADGEAGDDGSQGERDTVASDVENLSGTAGNDTLIGNAADNELHGDLGNDLILGLDGNDRITGMFGDDILDGGLGSDTLDGGEHRDTCRRGPGDTLTSCETTIDS